MRHECHRHPERIPEQVLPAFRHQVAPQVSQRVKADSIRKESDVWQPLQKHPQLVRVRLPVPRPPYDQHDDQHIHRQRQRAEFSANEPEQPSDKEPVICQPHQRHGREYAQSQLHHRAPKQGVRREAWRRVSRQCQQRIGRMQKILCRRPHGRRGFPKVGSLPPRANRHKENCRRQQNQTQDRVSSRRRWVRGVLRRARGRDLRLHEPYQAMPA